MSDIDAKILCKTSDINNIVSIKLMGYLNSHSFESVDSTMDSIAYCYNNIKIVLTSLHVFVTSPAMSSTTLFDFPVMASADFLSSSGSIPVNFASLNNVLI